MLARRGSIFAAFLKLFPVYLFIVPGLICFALAASNRVPELHARLFPEGALDRDGAQAAFPLMVQYLLPPGLRGIVVAGLLSALMGSLAGVFNACSTHFTVDLYEKWRPHATERQIGRTGRIATTVMVVIALAWIFRHVRSRNRLRTCLKSYFPQALDLVGEDGHTRMACDFLLKRPILALLRYRLRQALTSWGAVKVSSGRGRSSG
jgi:Na+/proline symporter